MDVYISHDGVVQKVMPSSVIYIDENTVEVQFTDARAGFATGIV
jgi:hypothetical protein